MKKMKRRVNQLKCTKPLSRRNCTLYLISNHFAISFLDIISIFCKDQSFSFNFLNLKKNFFWVKFFFWKNFLWKIWKIFIQNGSHSFAQTFENIRIYFWKPYAISIPMRGGWGGVAGQNFEKKAFEKFQFRKISVLNVSYLALRDF